MASAKSTKRILFQNLQYNSGRLLRSDEVGLGELMRISDQSERDLIAYLMAQPQARFDKLTRALEPRWREYSEMKSANRKRMREMTERRINGAA